MTFQKSPHGIEAVSIIAEMEKSYLDYAMSVIISRALPDVRDGLKPVHRRILYAMKEGDYEYNRPYRKSARIVGDVMGKYHPHGDTAIYDSMVRMAQDFSMRLPLIDGQGNFGSMDGDPPAAMRYTEARMAKTASYLLEDIKKQTVDFVPNYDDSTLEPSVLPARYPNILINGASGIAVGMSTNIPPHNLGEIIDGCCALIKDPQLSFEDLIKIIPGPDFPTGGKIFGTAGIHKAYTQGRGSVIVQSKYHFEKFDKNQDRIIITEVPYQTNKSILLERIAEYTKKQDVPILSDLRDESNRHGIRIVIELKKNVLPEVIVNQLFKYTPLQTSFSIHTLAIHKNKPEVMTIKNMLLAFLEFREEVLRKRYVFDLNKNRDRAHILLGLAVAVHNMDPIILLIKSSADTKTALQALLNSQWETAAIEPFMKLLTPKAVFSAHYQLSEVQARAILDLRLHRLTGLERNKILKDLQDVCKTIEEIMAILGSKERRFQIIEQELREIKEIFNTPRRTEIEVNELESSEEDFVKKEDMVVTITSSGFIKRVPLDTYRAQKRGGKGRSGVQMQEEDAVTQIFVADTHTNLLFFTSKGMVYKNKVYKLPAGSPTSKGRALINLLPLSKGEKISNIMPLSGNYDDLKKQSLIFSTTSGFVRRNTLEDFINVKSNGKIAMKLNNEEQLVCVLACEEHQDILLATQNGISIRFPMTDLRIYSNRNSLGVRGIKLTPGDQVISMSLLNHNIYTPEQRAAYLKASNLIKRTEPTEEILPQNNERSSDFYELQKHEEFIVTITASGYGKISSAYEYRVTARGGKGISNIELTKRNGPTIVASFPVHLQDQLMLVSSTGQVIRLNVNNIRVAGRTTQGVILFRSCDTGNVVSVAHLPHDNTEITTIDE